MLNLSDKGSGETEVFDYITAAEKDVNAAQPVFTVSDAVNAVSVIPDVSAAGPSTSDARIDADALLAERIQQEEREQFTVDEQAKMLVDLIAKRKRFFVVQRAKQIRNKPPTKAQLRNKMKLEEDDAEKEKLRGCLDIVPVDDIAIDVESLATKYPIVDWKTHTLTEHIMYYQIIRANGSSKNYKILTEMCDDFDRQDIMDLYKLVKERMASMDDGGMFDANKRPKMWKQGLKNLVYA
nr:hypothetical protein [Tanacetum cinerariifolium]